MKGSQIGAGGARGTAGRVKGQAQGASPSEVLSSSYPLSSLCSASATFRNGVYPDVYVASLEGGGGARPMQYVGYAVE